MSLDRTTIALHLVLATGCAAAAPHTSPAPQIGGLERHIFVLVGQRSLDEDDWSPVEDQPTLAFGYDAESPDWLLGYETGIAVSREETRGVDGETFELSIGARKTFALGEGNLHSYVGAGLAYINAEVEAGGVGEEDGSPAGYAHAGLAIDVSDAFQVGLDVRFLFGSDLETAGADTDADYSQVGIFLAIGF